VPILRDFERRLGNLVEGFFASTFRSGLQPVELAKRVMREMDAGRTVGVRDVWAPNHFVFSLSDDDGRRFQQAERALVGELEQVVRETALERGWGLVGPPGVELEIDEGLARGRFRCRATFVEGPGEIAPSVPAAGEATVALLEGDRVTDTFRLRETTTIGRLPESDIVVADPGASRSHARILRQQDGYVLSDLGSTNGTLVNGEAATERLLMDGDRITIGSTILEFRRG
jgi:FhaA, N-terminal domain/FHA domain